MGNAHRYYRVPYKHAFAHCRKHYKIGAAEFISKTNTGRNYSTYIASINWAFQNRRAFTLHQSGVQESCAWKSN